MDKTKMDKYGVVLRLPDTEYPLTMYRDPRAGVIAEGVYRLKMSPHALDGKARHPSIGCWVLDHNPKSSVNSYLGTGYELHMEMVHLSSKDHFARYPILVNTDLITEDDEIYQSINVIVSENERLNRKITLDVHSVEHPTRPLSRPKGHPSLDSGRPFRASLRPKRGKGDATNRNTIIK